MVIKIKKETMYEHALVNLIKNIFNDVQLFQVQ